MTMSPGAFQKFAIFVVEILDGNTAEYKPCAQFEGRFTEQLAKFKCNDGAGQLGQFVYIRMTELTANISDFVRFRSLRSEVTMWKI